MHFTKMEGLGNDYVYVNCFEEKVPDPVFAARMVSDRHTGIGSDGLILIGPSDKADFRMDVYNADGSRAEMCGNGIRCVGKYVYERGLTDKKSISVETLAGIRILNLNVSDNIVGSVTVDMGCPLIERCVQIQLGSVLYDIAVVYIGNPHAVIFVEDVDSFPVETVGARIEKHPLFLCGTNVEFVQITDAFSLRMRVWERGTGETYSCGTGACAAVMAGIASKKTENTATARQRGGDLYIQYDKGYNKLYMTGPARVVFDGYTDII